MVGPVELVPGESVFFIPQGGTPEAHGHFLQALKATWQLVPPADRRTILDHYQARFGVVRVTFGARLNDNCPLAMAGPEGCLLWCDSLRVLDLPGKEAWTSLVIAEELAHAYLIATQHATHASTPPNNNPASDEFQQWDRAREEGMKEVLFRWPFDRGEHEKLIAWVVETRGGLKKS